jgi:hyaluronoglucosaminidase
VLAEAGLVAGAKGSCDWPITFAAAPPALSGETRAAWDVAASSEERYLVVSSAAPGPVATLFAASERSALYALRALMALAPADAAGETARIVPDATLVDHPSFAWRGIVEGMYGTGVAAFGTQYSPGDRAALMRLVSRLRGNIYIYGPKDDPYARARWRVPYPATGAGSAQAIASAAHEADRILLRFVWSLSPGADFNWTSPASDLAAAKAKIDSVRALGVHHFAVFLDDNTSGSLAVAPQADLLNALNAYVEQTDPTDHLLVVLPRYAGQPDATTDAFGVALDRHIEVMWTGRCGRSCTVTAADFAAPNQSFRRTLSLWDNWPIDDTRCCGTVPIRMTGRSADLPGAVSGYYTNPVLNQAGSNLPLHDFLAQLGPVMDYMWNAPRYAAGRDAEDRSYGRWSGLLDVWVRDAQPCSKNCASKGWACDSPTSINYCDERTRCVTTLSCPGGCTPAQPDTCR